MPKFRVWVSLMVTLVAVAGCASWFRGSHTEEHQSDRQPAYIDRVDGPAIAPAAQPLTITVKGSLPTPAWKLDDVQVARDGQHVVVTIWSHLAKHGPVIEMLVPFTKTIALEGLTAGRYDVEVRGRADTTRHLDVTLQ